jgi:hypothetical protein
MSLKSVHLIWYDWYDDVLECVVCEFNRKAEGYYINGPAGQALLERVASLCRETRRLQQREQLRLPL